MPLFMDYHQGLSLSIEEVKKAHIADEAVQSRYGVIYHQFWVNEEDGTVFCLMEGPDKESCAAVHREAHGGVACSIVEVSTGFYQLFMGHGHLVEHGHVRHSDGTPDPGTRNILVVNIHRVATTDRSADHHFILTSRAVKDFARQVISGGTGREMNTPDEDSLLAVFDSSYSAVKCATQLQQQLIQHRSLRQDDEWNIEFRMGLSAGQPLTEDGDLFSDAITLARRLSSVASPNELLMSSRIQDLCNVNELIPGRQYVRILSTREEDFISSLFSISEVKLSDELFTVDCLCKDIGMSRPQLYRKTISLTGKSPNDFIKDLRMDKALALIRKKAGNISEIALEVGYSNPSYFARCFQMRYGCTPSRIQV